MGDQLWTTTKVVDSEANECSIITFRYDEDSENGRAARLAIRVLLAPGGSDVSAASKKLWDECDALEALYMRPKKDYEDLRTPASEPETERMPGGGKGEAPCDECDGTGVSDEAEDCPECDGWGFVCEICGSCLDACECNSIIGGTDEE